MRATVDVQARDANGFPLQDSQGNWLTVDGPLGVLEPYAYADRHATEHYVSDPSAEYPCRGRIIGRVTIDGRSSPNPAVREEALRFERLMLQIRQRYDTSRAFDQELVSEADRTAGYKNSYTHFHCSNPDQDTTCTRHTHRYLPEGTSYLWVDNLNTDPNDPLDCRPYPECKSTGGVRIQNEGYRGRLVIVPDNEFLPARTVVLRYCDHAGSDYGVGACQHYWADPQVDRAAWLPIPGDDHMWYGCGSGCCRGEDNEY